MMYSESNHPLGAGPGGTSPEAGTDVQQFLLHIRQTVGDGLQELLREDDEETTPGETSGDSTAVLVQEPAPDAAAIEVPPEAIIAPSQQNKRRSDVARRIGAGLRAVRQAAASGIDAGMERMGEAAQRRLAESERVEELHRRRRAEPKEVQRLRREIDGHMRYLNNTHAGPCKTPCVIETLAQRHITQMKTLGYDYWDFLHLEEGKSPYPNT